MAEMLKGFKNFEEMFRLAKLAKENGLGVSDNTADVMFGDMMGRSKEKERNWLSEDEDNDLLREAKGDGKLGFDGQVFLERINGAKKEIPNVSGNSKIDDFNEYGQMDLLKMNQNGSQDDMSWKPNLSPYLLASTSGAVAIGERKVAPLATNAKGERISDFYDVQKPTKAYLVVENYPPGAGHVGIVFEDDDGNMIGYHFGSWLTEEEKKSSGDWGYDGEGRMIIERNPYHRMKKYGGQKLLLDMKPEEVLRAMSFYSSFEVSEQLMERKDDLYDDVLRKYRLTGKFSRYNMLQYFGGLNCVDYVLAGIQYGCTGDKEKEFYYRSIDGSNTFGRSPHLFASKLKEDKRAK